MQEQSIFCVLGNLLYHRLGRFDVNEDGTIGVSTATNQEVMLQWLWGNSMMIYCHITMVTTIYNKENHISYFRTLLILQKMIGPLHMVDLTTFTALENFRQATY